MKVISIIKSRISILIQLFTRSQKSKNTQIKLVRKEAPKLIKLGPTKIIPTNEIDHSELRDFTPKIIKSIAIDISNFKPGYVLDTNTIMNLEDYPDLLLNGKKITNKLKNKPIYIISTVKSEFFNKKCPKGKLTPYNRELVIDNKYTGKKRNFNKLLEKLPHSFESDIHYVDITNCKIVIDEANKHLSNLGNFGLHKPDNMFLAFAKLTQSILVTCDKDLIRCCCIAGCTLPIEFLSFAEKILQPSPITLTLRCRRELRKKHPSYFKSENQGVWH